MRVRRVPTRKKLRLRTEQASDRKEKPDSLKWWWDPPKLIPMIISSVALLMSSLGWWESHRSRMISSEINRPILEITPTDVSISDGGELNQIPSLFIEVRAKNVGKSTALIKNIKLAVSSGFPNGCKQLVSDDEDIESGEAIPLLIGEEMHNVTQLALTPECRHEGYDILKGLLAISYVDNGSGLSYEQRYYLEYLTDAKKLDSGEMQYSVTSTEKFRVSPKETPSPSPAKPKS